MIEDLKPYYWFLCYNRHFITYFWNRVCILTLKKSEYYIFINFIKYLHATCVTLFKNTHDILYYIIFDMHFFKINNHL